MQSFFVNLDLNDLGGILVFSRNSCRALQESSTIVVILLTQLNIPRFFSVIFAPITQ